MNAIDKVEVEISVVLGKASMPIHQLLRMGRGAVIELEAHESEEVWLLANNQPIARGEIVVQGEHVGVSITEVLQQHTY